MRLTLTLDDELLAKAEEYTGISNKSALVRESLKKLVEREAARRLARLGGSEPQQADPAAADETWVIGPSTSPGGRGLPSSAPMSREYPHIGGEDRGETAGLAHAVSPAARRRPER